MRLQTRIFLVLFSFVITACCYAQTPRQELKQKLNAFKTMKANFSEVVKNKRGRVLQRTRGQLLLLRPHKFRWTTRRPLKQLIVGDGKKIWTYDIGLKQVTVKSFPKQRGNIPALILSGYDRSITRSYRMYRSGGGIILDSKRKGAIFRRLQLWFKGNRLYRLRLNDRLGNITTITFSNVRLNKKLSSRLFRFTPPRGVDVIKR